MQDEVNKLQKQVKSSNSSVNSSKLLKQEVDSAKDKLSNALNEIKVLQDKLKSLKSELARKDQLIKDNIQQDKKAIQKSSHS